MSNLPIPPTSTLFSSRPQNRSDPANDAARIVGTMEDGKLDDAMQLFAELMGVQSPDEIAPISKADTSSYESALLTQIGAQMHLRKWAMTSLPRMLAEIKIKA
jgi:hypothetical protein